MPKNKSTSDEKRRFVRIVSKNLVKIISSEAFAKEKISNIVDLSGGGIRMVSGGKADEGSEMRLRINLAEKDIQIEVDAVVRWVKQWQNSKDIFYMGLQFVNVDPDVKNLLDSYVKDMKGKK